MAEILLANDEVIDQYYEVVNDVKSADFILLRQALDFYLKNVGYSQQSGFDFHMAQNKYCHWQKQNPHVVRSMVSMGVEESVIRRFVNDILFPEVG